MKRKRGDIFFGTVWLVLLLCNVARPQERQPLSVKDIEELLRGGVTPKRMVTLIGKEGIDFEVTEGIKERLRRAGADEGVLNAVDRAERRKTAEVQEAGEMVSVPEGDFYMGCNETVDTECDDDEKPGRHVSVGAFQIDKTEVTVAQFSRCVDAGACSSDGLTMPYWDGKEQPEWAWACNWGKTGREQHPINCVDWLQAQRYCSWAGKRLPTEAEWEKAARGTDGRKYPWGNRGYGAAGGVANIADETAKRSQPKWPTAPGYDDGYYGTAPVGSFPAGASPYGALDMVGNVWEWTADWSDSEHKGRVLRGGSCYSDPGFARASFRFRPGPGDRSGGDGFRCVR